MYYLVIAITAVQTLLGVLLTEIYSSLLEAILSYTSVHIELDKGAIGA